MRRWQDQAAPATQVPLAPRHVAVLEQLRGGPVFVGELADLDRAGLIERYPDPRDRRRTFVQVVPEQAELVKQWLDGAASPIARVLGKLDHAEQEAFLKAMNLLEGELSPQDAER